MKLSRISACTAAIALLCACTAGAENSTKQDEAAAKAEKIIEAEAAGNIAETPAAEAVIALTDDARYTPSTKVERPTLLDFNAVWCGPCRKFAPTFHAVAEKYAGKADFISVDTDANPATAIAFGIQVIPSVVILMPDDRSRILDGRQLLTEGYFERTVSEITK